MANGTTTPVTRVKPLLRGVSHEIAFFVALGAAAWLVTAASTPRARLATAIYGISLAALFGISALYHRPMWAPAPRARMRRLDHAAIFLLVAGTYTPICVLALGDQGPAILVAVWVGAVLGIFQAVFWIRAPRWFTALLYVALGWIVIAALPALVAAIGYGGLAWLVGGGGLYTLGAVIYATKRPDPFPRVFGYHEVFHALVIAAAVSHFVVVARIVLGA